MYQGNWNECFVHTCTCVGYLICSKLFISTSSTSLFPIILSHSPPCWMALNEITLHRGITDDRRIESPESEIQLCVYLLKMSPGLWSHRSSPCPCRRSPGSTTWRLWTRGSRWRMAWLLAELAGPRGRRHCRLLKVYPFLTKNPKRFQLNPLYL
jgi:hypothetical protein